MSARFGATAVVHDVSLRFGAGTTTAIVGPSGCGKSTLLRCLNRMHETVEGASMTGDVQLDGESVYRGRLSPLQVRRRVAMVLQEPSPFPTMSIRDNVAAGLAGRAGKRPRGAEADTVVEQALIRAALWHEVRDRLGDSPLTLSGGQQQRLCIARALATGARVLLLDEPTAALDPRSAQAIEELLYELRREMTIVLVTHNLQQAARASTHTAFLLAGRLVECAETDAFFTRPSDPRTEAYVTGRAP
ncbi:MAG: phosphate ABC transporter ATP-binding protein [Gemmatimonadaceae bacterium]|nr:phosphate ABC transporter ATP-binding protein [Gemmatimonadaceae bacterium]